MKIKYLINFIFTFCILTSANEIVHCQTITYSSPWHYVNTPHGQIKIGPQNNSGAHIYTDLPRFYLNKPIHSITGEFSAYNATNLQLQTAGITRMTVLRNNGNVGIGYTSPVEKLHINGAIRGNGPAGALSISTQHGEVTVGAQNNSGAHIYTDLPRFYLNKPIYSITGEFSAYNATNLQLQTAGITRMTVLKSTGNVGIGTTSPQSKLDVNGTATAKFLKVGTANIPANYIAGFDGKIITEEVRVKPSAHWPDYVFASDYDLLPIQDLEEYITENQHLPNVPSAEEIEQQGGADLGAMNVILLEKVEELTLYIIQMNEKIEALNQEVETLNEQIEK